MWLKLVRILTFLQRTRENVLEEKKYISGLSRGGFCKGRQLGADMVRSANKATIKWLVYWSKSTEKLPTVCKAAVAFDKPKPEEGCASDFFYCRNRRRDESII